jgi:hypothetical protein
MGDLDVELVIQVAHKLRETILKALISRLSESLWQLSV